MKDSIKKILFFENEIITLNMEKPLTTKQISIVIEKLIEILFEKDL